MEIIEKKIEEIIPYNNNAKKHDDKQIQQVANSISQFGFVQPLVIDSDNIIIIGHCRYEASKLLKMKTVPCVIADTLTEEETRMLRLADNKLNESEWDLMLLNDELDSIFDLNIEDFGFDLPDFDDEPEEENERHRTGDAYNLTDYDPERTEGIWGMPVLEKCNYVPTDLIGFNYMLSSKDFDKGIHFYTDDYQYERLWNEPYFYIDKIAQFDCALTPDFSLYLDMPNAMKMWNVYRSKLLGQMMQDRGIKVIPTLQWAEPETYEWCFDGIPKGGTVSVSTIGVKRDAEALKIWYDGMDAAIERIKPKTIVLYGGRLEEYDFGKIKVVEIENHVTERMKGSKK